MKEQTPGIGGTLLTRRAFIAEVAVASAVAGAASMTSPAGVFGEALDAARGPRRDVVWFFMDRLFLDATGKAPAYHPPLGARSAAPVAHLTEEAFRSLQCYV
jgi:hypothetical protein